MNDVDVLEARVRDALGRRAEATTVNAPRTVPHAGDAPRAKARPHARGVLRVAVALGVMAGVAGAALLTRLGLDGSDTSDGPVTLDAPVTTGTTAGGVATSPLIEYHATTLPDGYREVRREDVPGDVRDEFGMGAASIGTNCLDWSADGSVVTCERYLAVRNHHYGQPGEPQAITVTTLLGLSADTLGLGEGEPVDVQGVPAQLESTGLADGGAARLVWTPAPGTLVVLTALDPSVPDADLLAVAQGLQPVEAAAPVDLPLVVASDEVTADGDLSENYVWAKPGPEPCMGGLLANTTVRQCLPGTAPNPMTYLGGATSPVIAGGVSEAVDRVVVETSAGPIEADLVPARRPFNGERFFLVPRDAGRGDRCGRPRS